MSPIQLANNCNHCFLEPSFLCMEKMIPKRNSAISSFKMWHWRSETLLNMCLRQENWHNYSCGGLLH